MVLNLTFLDEMAFKQKSVIAHKNLFYAKYK